MAAVKLVCCAIITGDDPTLPRSLYEPSVDIKVEQDEDLFNIYQECVAATEQNHSHSFHPGELTRKVLDM